jgi:hypothetical protein
MTSVAIVLDPAGLAVSAILMTSPPMLLGRKLLKKVATRKEVTSLRPRTMTRAADSSKPQRQALSSTITRYKLMAAASHTSDAPRACAHSWAKSTREKSTVSNPTLTTILSSQTRARRLAGEDTAANGNCIC